MFGIFKRIKLVFGVREKGLSVMPARSGPDVQSKLGKFIKKPDVNAAPK